MAIALRPEEHKDLSLCTQKDPPRKARHTSHPPRKLSIRWWIFGGFALFTAVILVLLWVFQVALLDTFYQTTKVQELENCAQQLADTLEEDDDTITNRLDTMAKENQISTVICNREGKIYYRNYSFDSILKDMTWLDLRSVYQQTLRKGGTYVQQYERPSQVVGFLFSTYPIEDSPLMPGLDRVEVDPIREDGGKGMLYAMVVPLKNGNDRLLLVNCSLTPVSATVETLKVELWVITFLMILLAFFLALFLAKRISSPISTINESAKNLALGKYDITFQEEGYQETAELGHTLNYASRELSKVEGLRRDLIANISHDLRTPLTMITGYAEVMRDLPGENTPENVQIIIDEANRLTSLVNDILDLSKMQAGAIELMPETFCLTQNIRDILARYDKLADYHFTFEAQSEAWVFADPLKISQVVYNLINNAITYTGPDKQIQVRQRIHDGKVRIEVIDTGEGIAEDQLPNIWERYYKVDKTHRRATVGTGLGLSIVKTILDLHSADFGVHSRLHEGSTFWFELTMMNPVSPSDRTAGGH